MNKQLKFYKSLFNKSFFVDKFYFDNSYQCPRIKTIVIKFTVNSQFEFKFKFYKVLLAFYLLTGQKPKLLIKNYNLRGVKGKKVLGLLLTLKSYDFFLNFLILRQLALISFFKPFSLDKKYSFTAFLTQKTQDDDILFQLLNMPKLYKYQICLNLTSVSKFQLQTLLLNFKIPCQLI